MAIVVDDNTPDFLREFLISQGVISVKDTETGETGVVPIQPRRRRLNTGEDLGGEDFQQESPVTTAASGDIFDTLRGLFSSDNTDPDFQAMLTDVANQGSPVAASVAQGEYLVEPNQPSDMGYELTTMPDDTPSEIEAYRGFANSPPGPTFVASEGQTAPNYDRSINEKTGEISPGLVDTRGQAFYDSMSQPQTSGNSVLDGAANLFSDFGNYVDNSLSKLGGGNFSNPFDFDYTPSISDRYGPMNPLSGVATALSDRYLSTDRKIGQTIGGVLGAGASAVIPGANILGLFGAAMGRMGAHHDFNPSTDYNLNFDTRSGRTDWGSLSPGAGGSQYGSLSNENMIEDIAKDNPNFEISLNDGRDGYITAENWVAANEGLKAGNAAFGFNLEDPFEGYTQTDYYAAAADSSGDMFQSFGGGTLGGALTEYGQTGTGAFRNEAGAIADQLGLGYNQETGLADRMVDAAKQGVPLGLLGEDALNLDMSMGDLGFGMDFDADDGMGSMGDMGFGEGDFGTDGII